MRIGLVLGAGGVLGGSWMAGALHAVSEELGWDPAGAESVVGTSVGAMVGALLTCGVSPSYLVAHCSGEEPAGVSAALARAEASRLARATGRERRALAELGPGSWPLALASLARPHRHTPAAVIAGWLPLGRTATEPLKDAVRTAAAGRVVAHRGYRAVACDYATGRRMTLDATHAPLAEVVAASCAIPGFYSPVAIGRRRFVDGAVHSSSNLDVAAGRGLDLVICVNPMSAWHIPRPRTMWERAVAVARQDAGRRVCREARAVRESGTDVLLIQPTADDLHAIAAGHTRRQVVETAIAGTLAYLRRCSAVAA